MMKNNLSWPAGVRAAQFKSAPAVKTETPACVSPFEIQEDVTWVARTPAGHDNFGIEIEL
jgi:hypothetical protein